MKINNNVLKLYHYGYDNSGNLILRVLTQNSVNLTAQELLDLIDKGGQYFSLSELKSYSTQNVGVELQNVSYQNIDVSFRCSLYSNYNPDDIRKEIQINFAKKYDYRDWDGSEKIEWYDLLQIVKNTSGIKYVPDTYFYPGTDFTIANDKLPRFRGFIMMDLDGNILTDVSGILNPIYYPNQADFSYQQTVLNSI